MHKHRQTDRQTSLSQYTRCNARCRLIYTAIHNWRTPLTDTNQQNSTGLAWLACSTYTRTETSLSACVQRSTVQSPTGCTARCQPSHWWTAYLLICDEPATAAGNVLRLNAEMTLNTPRTAPWCTRTRRTPARVHTVVCCIRLVL